jgi:hypothetical protein
MIQRAALSRCLGAQLSWMENSEFTLNMDGDCRIQNR